MEDQNAKLDAVLEGISNLPTRTEFNQLETKERSAEKADHTLKKSVLTYFQFTQVSNTTRIEIS